MKIALLILTSFASAQAAISVRLMPAVPSPQPVGTMVSLVPRLELPAPTKPLSRDKLLAPPKFTYQYSVSIENGPFHVVRDFSQDPQYVWNPPLVEHHARVRVTVRNQATSEIADAELPYQIVSRVAASGAVVTPTSHPLIALFSSPPCQEGTQFRVAFRRKGDEGLMRTQAEPCRGSLSNNVYVAGMLGDSEYEMRAEFVSGSDLRAGEWISFHTGLSDGVFPPVASKSQRTADDPAADSIVIRSIMDPWRPAAVDLAGNVLWYLKSGDYFLTRVLPGGRFLGLADGANSINDMKRWQIVREVNLLGSSIRETNIGRVAEQLESRGIKSDCRSGSQECVPGFHHEAIRLPNGHTLAIAGLERMFPAGTQGSKEPVDVLGDLILDLNEDLQLTWVWNSFDHLDLKRASLGGEKCQSGPGNDGCTPVFLAKQANGWLHSNSLYYIPQTGDLLLSVPEQDWILKIDYKNGTGSGKILWRLGKDGDFTAKSDDPYPWFSYQHDVGFDPATGLLIIFDDGSRRKAKYPQSNNRGQAWKIDEDSRTATLVVNADLGVYSVAVGSAQPLSDGNYSFESGFVNPGPAGLSAIYSQTTETSGTGTIVYTQQVEGTLTYRSFRVPDLYSAPRK